MIMHNKVFKSEKISWKESRKIQEILWKTLVYIMICFFGLIVLLPFLWVISSSFKTEMDLLLFPPKWIPSKIIWRNYPEALALFDFPRALKNTLVITLSVLVGQLLTASLTAFTFSRLKFKLREPLFILVLSTMMIPYQVTLIPSYILFRLLHWIDTFLPLIVPAYCGGQAFFIFLFRQFFMTIPTELDDSAKIDGCGVFGIYWRIVLPLSKPVLAVVAIFSFFFTWNDFLAPLIYLSSPENYTLSIGLQYFHETLDHFAHIATRAHLMAASLVVMLPCILIFFFAQRYFIQGIVITGLKE